MSASARVARAHRRSRAVATLGSALLPDPARERRTDRWESSAQRTSIRSKEIRDELYSRAETPLYAVRAWENPVRAAEGVDRRRANVSSTTFGVCSRHPTAALPAVIAAIAWLNHVNSPVALDLCKLRAHQRNDEVSEAGWIELKGDDLPPSLRLSLVHVRGCEYSLSLLHSLQLATALTPPAPSVDPPLALSLFAYPCWSALPGPPPADGGSASSLAFLFFHSCSASDTAWPNELCDHCW